MTANEFELPMILNGGRHYVQGTQLIACAARVLGDDLTLLSAGFHAITDRAVALRRDRAEDPASRLGNVVFADRGGTRCEAHFIARDRQAPHGDLAPRCRYERAAQDGPLTARFDVSGLHESEDFLVALIQSVKGLHEVLTDTVRDVWFTGLRGADLPMRQIFPHAEGQLDITFRRMLRGSDAWQTLMGYALTREPDEMVTRGTLTFAFKSEIQPVVD